MKILIVDTFVNQSFSRAVGDEAILVSPEHPGAGCESWSVDAVWVPMLPEPPKRDWPLQVLSWYTLSSLWKNFKQEADYYFWGYP